MLIKVNHSILECLRKRKDLGNIISEIRQFEAEIWNLKFEGGKSPNPWVPAGYFRLRKLPLSWWAKEGLLLAVYCCTVGCFSITAAGNNSHLQQILRKISMLLVWLQFLTSIENGNFREGEYEEDVNLDERCWFRGCHTVYGLSIDWDSRYQLSVWRSFLKNFWPRTDFPSSLRDIFGTKFSATSTWGRETSLYQTKETSPCPAFCCY